MRTDDRAAGTTYLVSYVTRATGPGMVLVGIPRLHAAAVNSVMRQVAEHNGVHPAEVVILGITPLPDQEGPVTGEEVPDFDPSGPEDPRKPRDAFEEMILSALGRVRKG